jgi:RND family efflux transporter MFP subunit
MKDLEKTKLIAPFDGMVAKINLSIGQQAPSNQAVVILDISRFYVDLPIAEVDIAMLTVDQTVELRFDALPNATIQGKVARISDTATVGDTVTYTVRVEIDPAGQTLLSTMSVTANIITSNVENVLRLRNRYIRVDRAKNLAYATVKQADGTFKEIEIKIGMANDAYTEVKAGLKLGDVVSLPVEKTVLPRPPS